MPDPGLCAACLHARRLQNDRGSVFWLCEASRDYPELPKYPALPVRECIAFQPETEKEKGSRPKS